MRFLSVRSLLTPITVLASQQRFAGHAKWQNIAHTKAANDKAKGQRTNRYCMMIRRACAHGTDPKVNDKLRDVIAQALKCQIARATIDRQIERAKNVKIREVIVEVATPGGAFLLCEVETDNISRTRADLKKIMRKIPGTGIMREGAARMSFEERGVIVIGKKDKNGKMIDKERAEDIAIEAGAEEVGMEEEDEGKEKGADDGTDVPTWTLYTMARDVMSVKGKIDELQDIEILEAQVRYLPVHYVLLNEKDAATAATLIERLQELEEVSMIHDNIKPSEA